MSPIRAPRRENPAGRVCDPEAYRRSLPETTRASLTPSPEKAADWALPPASDLAAGLGERSPPG